MEINNSKKAIPSSFLNSLIKQANVRRVLLLDQRHTGKQGRPALAKVESTAKYKLSRNYTTANLETALAVYDLWVANNAKPKAEQIKQWEIGVELKLNKLAIKDAYSGLKQDRAVSRNLLGAIVKRYLTQAQKTIKSLEDGVFPVIK